MTVIDEYGVSYSEGFTELVFVPETFTHIILDVRAFHIYSNDKDDNAFASCRNVLEEVVFPEGSQLQEIRNGTFYQCTSLKSINLTYCTKLTSIGALAFSQCSSLKTLILPPNLQEIGDDCFDSSALECITIPKSISLIGQRAFSYCNKLTSVIFEDNVSNLTEFKAYTFRNCNLSTIRIPKSVTTIGWAIFEGIQYMKSISVEDGNKGFKIISQMLCSIDDRSLQYCPSALTTDPLKIPDDIEIIQGEALHCNTAQSFIFPTSLKTIKNYAALSSRIKTLEIPLTLQSLEAAAFQSCTSLSQITLSTSINSLPASCFERTNISEIIIPDNVVFIGQYCFAYCTNLMKLQLPEGIQTLQGGFIAGCPNITIVFNESVGMIAENNMIMKSDKSSISQYFGSKEDDVVSIPHETKTILPAAFAGSLVKEIQFPSNSLLMQINQEAFRDCTHLTTIIFPKYLSTIGERAFRSCTKLTELIFCENIAIIEKNCFDGCISLESVTFNEIMTCSGLSIGDSVFTNCQSLSKITFGEGLLELGQEVFQLCTSLSNIIFPTSLRRIDECMFDGSSVKSITFSGSKTNLNEIPSKAFYNANQLSEFQLISPISSIGASAFAKTALTSIQLPESVVSISMLAFNQCTQLTIFSLNNPESSLLQKLDSSVFQGCRNLQTIDVSNKYFVTLNNALFDFDQTTLYLFPPAASTEFFQIPSPVKIISPYAFYECQKLQIIMLSDDSKLETISVSAFQGCSSLKFINLPLSVTSFGADCFKGCDSLSCGLIISNKTVEYRETLFNNGMPKKCFFECNLKMTCKQSIHFHISIITYLMFLF